MQKQNTQAWIPQWAWFLMIGAGGFVVILGLWSFSQPAPEATTVIKRPGTKPANRETVVYQSTHEPSTIAVERRESSTPAPAAPVKTPSENPNADAPSALFR